MGTIFISLPTPPKPGLVTYRVSLKVLASAYFVLAILILIIIVFKLPDNAREHLTFTGISISSFQAFLFTFALIALLNPKYVTFRHLLKQLLPILVLILLFVISNMVYTNPVITHLNEISVFIKNPTLWLRLAFYFFYIFQLVYYTWLYFRVERNYKTQALNYFSDDTWLKLSWVRVAFISALGVGIIAMISYLFHQKYDWIFTLIYTVFYFGFALEYIKYNKIYVQIEPVVVEEKVEFIAPDQNKTRTKPGWVNLRKQVIENQYYLELGINIEEMARRLKIGRTNLSIYINREEGMNFNGWVNTLRIEKAKELLIQYPDEPLGVIAEKVGYSEHANFSRQFKLVTGESPLLWKKQQLTSTLV
ncbi:MAG: hypothetical protein A2W95_12760 [Bacteroidetes bacterium GWA2_40_14]|nr:MAG: hypothetical protein A2W95_12760 [Bacteroidetes bacterium GWA2_40_14]